MPDITLTLTVQQAQRVLTAFGRYWSLKDALGVPRDATAAEVKEFLRRQLQAVVIQQERRTEEAKIVVPEVVAT